MHPSFRLRLLFLLTAVFVVLGVVAFLAHLTWSQATAVRTRFREVESESVRVAEHVRVAVQALDTDLLRYKLRHDPADWTRFTDEANALRRWLDDQHAALRTARESEILRAIDVALASYLNTARVHADDDPTKGVSAEQLAALTAHSNALLSLGFDLAEAHSDTLDDTLERADNEVSRIEITVFVALGMLVAFGAGTGWLVYRGSVAPLQRQLRDSRMQLQRQEKLASLGVLSAGVAHEIRNPLTAVKARLFTLRKAVGQDPSAAEDVAVINEEVDRLERIVRTFLRLARPPDPVLADVDPLEMLRHVRDLVAPQWAKTGVRIELDESPVLRVRADRDQIGQALLNLVQNAAEAMPGGGVIQLRARADGTRQPGSRAPAVQLEVSDNGPGITTEVQARLFDPFFTTKSGGTGLGLALTARIMEKHGGSIHFDTAPGRGTTFALLLPAAKS
jgi:signal transduction histidine kinase